jgi:hypothetical protein
MVFMPKSSISRRLLTLKNLDVSRRWAISQRGPEFISECHDGWSESELGGRGVWPMAVGRRPGPSLAHSASRVAISNSPNPF